MLVKAALDIPSTRAFDEALDLDGPAIERTYWRGRLVDALERHGIERTFREMTAHAPPEPFEFDAATRCMRSARRTE